MINKYSSPFLALSLTCALFLPSCGSNKESGSATALSLIAGVYDDSVDHQEEGIDELYLEIDSRGYLSSYDYLGDSFDNYLNCYYIEQNWGQLIHLSENTFRYISYYEAVETSYNVIVTVAEGGDLTITNEEYPDVNSTVTKTSLIKSDFLSAECREGSSGTRTNGEILEKHKENSLTQIMPD
jgi:hypothetical protein